LRDLLRRLLQAFPHMLESLELAAEILLVDVVIQQWLAEGLLEPVRWLAVWHGVLHFR
jgi:hypothetical protein